MKVITALSRKGGSGKSALMRSLASAAISQSKKTAIIDADPQNGLLRWHNRIEDKNGLLTVQGLDEPGQLADMIEDLEEKVDYAFIDTMGAAGVWADMLVEQSDHLICPMMLTASDLEITKDTFNYYCHLRERVDNPDELPSFSVVITRMPAKPTRAVLEVAKEALGMFPILDCMFVERSQHQDVDREGLLHDLVNRRLNDKNPLIRSHAKHYQAALDEAITILEQVEKAK